MSSYKFKPEPKRVVCQCQSSGCYKGVYLDANGVLQNGVEVLPATMEAHERADKRGRISQSTTDGLDSRQAETSSQAPTTDSPESLISPLDRLVLALSTGKHSKRSHNNQGVSEARPSLSGDLFEHATRDMQNNTDVNSPTTAGNKETVTDEGECCVVDAEICTARDVARDKGVPQYDCGKWHWLMLS